LAYRARSKPTSPKKPAKGRALRRSGSQRGLLGRLSVWKRALLAIGVIIAAFYGAAFLLLFLLRWIDPPTTSVQIERRVESWFAKPGPGSQPYHKEYIPLPISRIAPDLQHAVVSAEDARFYKHNGFDWTEIEKAANNDLEGQRLRGASTITQQLVKNLFLTTSRTAIRKAIEVTVVPLAEAILGKQRILELYLNVIEWGPGVYGAEAAARYHYRTTAARLTREEAARLAAIIPAPRHRKPALMSESSERIQKRMREVGW
jgi:monofunctional glycosyltransferase